MLKEKWLIKVRINLIIGVYKWIIMTEKIVTAKNNEKKDFEFVSSWVFSSNFIIP